MTEFVQVGGVSGGLFLPAELASRAARAGARDSVTHDPVGRTGAEIAALGEQDVIAMLAAAREVRARADAAEAHALVRLDRLRGRDRYVADEAALELRVSRRAAQQRLARAHALTERMPRLLELMESGEIEGFPAGKVTDVTAALDNDAAREVDQQLAGKLESGRVTLTDPVAVVRAARRLVEKIDPNGQAERARRARAGRRVELLPGEHAMSTLSGELPAELAAAAYDRIDGMARTLRQRGEERTLDQLRADVYTDLLLGNDPGVAAPEASATVFVHLPADTALLMNDSGCELSGYGPIPAAVAREIMTNSSSAWRKVLTDPATGTPQNLGRHRRKPSAFIRDLVAVRDRECSVPGCHRPAQRADFDHLHEWAAGGSTGVDNAAATCERDHYRKDAPGWFYQYEPGRGLTTVITPGGRIHTKTGRTIIEPRASAPHVPLQHVGPAPPGDEPPV